MAELELTPSICSSSYSFMEPEADPPVGLYGTIPDADAPLLAPGELEQILRSTPSSQGTALRTRNPANIVNIKSDLKETQTISFSTMMKMFLVRNRVNVISRADIDGLTNRIPDLMKEADPEYLELLQQAIDFCNLDIDKDSSLDREMVALCKFVKKNMRAFCRATDRYLPIVNVLNAILRIDGDGEMMFIRNDPMFVESTHLPAYVTKRNPDIVLAELESCKKWLGVEESATFEQCTEGASESQGKKGKGKAEKWREKCDWTPIVQFWEFKKLEKLKDLPKIFKSKFDINSLTPWTHAPAELPTSSAPVCESSSMAAKRQNSGNLENPIPTKRARTALIGPSGRIMPSFPELDDDVQCAYYAIELLRVSWKTSHASGILLKDQLLEVLWYDSQGCVRTTPIDIVNQLPLLVVLVRAQRRSGYLSGLRNTHVPGSFKLINQPTPRFQLVGRMSSSGGLKEYGTAPSTSMVSSTSAAPVTQISGDSNLDKATHFFKSSWTEDIRPREHDIIATAVMRANDLPEHFRNFVLDHLPTISASNEIYNSSTAIIRTLLGLSTDGARTQYLMCSNLLENLLGVAEDFAVFKGILRDAVRAHRLLWVIGISHGDVSFHNIMIKPGTMVGVLNDFDLASVMERGATSPPKIGFRRTGTPLFMAVDLLSEKALRAEVPRLYRHDLESFAWVLLYASLCVKNGKENLDVEPFRDWVLAIPSELRKDKKEFLLDFRRIADGSPDKEWLVPTFRIWFDILVAEDKPGPEHDPKLLGDILRAWKIEKEEWEDFIL